jgi:flagellar biosynthetic protein FlhB
MADSELDRNLAATPYKLQKARERGQVPRSPDVVAAIVFTTAMAYLLFQGWQVWRAQFLMDRAILARAGAVESGGAALMPLIDRLMVTTVTAGAPFFVALMLAAIVANLMQTGPVLSAHPIKLDWERLNPASGFKRIFSMRTLFVAGRALLKLFLLAGVTGLVLDGMLAQFYRLSALSPSGLVHRLFDDFGALGIKVAAALAFIAMLDLIYTRFEFAKKMRMSRHELKEEIKHRDGDPRIRARLRQLRREMLKRSRAISRTRNADVLITNPTHVAVALRYVKDQMVSPQVIAKGQGFMAAIMRQIAARHQIPVVQNPSLARALYRGLPIDHHVPPELYTQVARIIVWVFARRDAALKRRLGAGPRRF